VTKRSQNSQKSWIYFFLVTTLYHTALNIQLLTFAGDVLADRGVTCNENTKMYLVEVKTPSFNWRSRRLTGIGNYPQYVCRTDYV